MGENEDAKQLTDATILRQIVTQPVNLKKWAIFCIEQDIESAKGLQDRFYFLAE